jgi:hypothetical protein
MKTDHDNLERLMDDPAPPDEPMQRTHRLIFGRRVHRSTLMISLMFILGAGWIVWESRSIGPKTAAADSLDVDSNVQITLNQMQMEAAIGPAHDAQKEHMFGPLRKDAQRRNIRLCALKRDPFEYEKKKVVDPSPVETPTTAPVVEELPPSVEGLELQSILIGASPTAIINGYLFQEGQTVADWKVVQILPGKVVLQWRNHKHVLTMP